MNIVEKAIDIAKKNPDTVFYRYYGAIFHKDDAFSRMDKSYIYTMFMDDEGVVFQKLQGYKDRDRETREPIVVFGKSPVVQITDGPRRGHLIQPSRLFPKERFIEAGYKKVLGVDKLDPHNAEDLFALNVLEDLVENGFDTKETIEYPDIFLCTDRENTILSLRGDEEAYKYLAGVADLEQGIDLALIKNRQKLQVNAGRSRIGYNFRYIHGKGVLAVDGNMNGRWNGIYRDDAYLSRPDLRVDLL